MHIALLPLYVDYYENVVPDIESKKAALIKTARNALGDHSVTTFERVRDVAAAQLAREQLLGGSFDVLIVLPLVATFSQLSDEVVKGWNKPLLLLSTSAGARVPSPLTMAKVVAESQSFGSQAIANGWMRQGVRFTALHVEIDSPAGAAAVRQWLEVEDAVRGVRTLRMGLFGSVFGGMTDIQLSQEDFHRQAGATVVSISMSRVHSAMREANGTEVLELEATLSRRFKWGALSRTEKDLSLRAALAITRITSEERLDCAAFNSHGPEGLQSTELGLMAALGVTLATSNGCPMSEVGDLCTAFVMWLGRRLGGASYYTELDSAYMPPHEWLLLNSGEFDLNWLRPGVRPQLLPNTNFAGVNGRGASVSAPLRDGPATILNFTPLPSSPQSYRIQYCEGKIRKRWHPELRVGNATFEAPGSARRAYARWLNAGPVHHSATSPGLLGAALSHFCRSLGWKALPIDG